MVKYPKILYHTSYMVVDKINLLMCRDGLDFGKGFYTTDDYKQAKNFINNSIKKSILAGKVVKNTKFGYINIFEFSDYDDLKIYKFNDANYEWLHYVASNRKNGLFSSTLKKFNKFDVLIGKIANDKTAKTLNGYVSGDFGNPGEKIADEFTINALLTNILKDQYCFKTNNAIKCLKYLGSNKIYAK